MPRRTIDQHVRRVVQFMVIAALSLPLATPAGADDGPSLIDTTARYEFHSNFWINLHHFLFTYAKRPDDGRLPDGRAMSRAEYQAIYDAVGWYREHLADHSLLMNDRLYAVKRALIMSGPDALPDADAISDDHRTHLEAVAPYYRARYWARHDRQNRSLFAWHEARIRALEEPILDRIADLSQQPWPDGRIRVDLSWDSNWAGAYCTTQPVHAVMTSRPSGPDNDWPPGGWFELLFHEPSHALIAPDRYPVARAISAAQQALGIESSGQLWHAILFYFSGTAVREALAAEGIDHTLLMVDGGIFARYHEAVFAHLPDYVAGDQDFGDAVHAVVAALQE